MVLRIRDTGSGINPDDLERIFEPFYSRKKMGRSGSGLGLAVVYGVVRDHNGYIDIKTELGQGTEFVLYFPVARDLAESDERQDIDIYGKETILVVDDVPQQRNVATRLLSRLGYTVSSVENGHEALTYLQQHDADLVIIDMIMEEGFDGLTTYQAIMKIRPGQRCIIASGFSESDRVKEAMRLGFLNYVRKPYTVDCIGRVTRESLDRELKPITA